MVDISNTNLSDLQQGLEDVLENLEVINKTRLSRDSFYSIFKLDYDFSSKKIYNVLQKFIDETPIFTLVFSELDRFLENSYRFEKSASTLLKNVPGFIGVKPLASSIVSTITEIPQQYYFCIELPLGFNALFSEGENKNTISKHVSIISIDDEMINTFPTKTGTDILDKQIAQRNVPGLLNFDEDNPWNPNKIAFQCVGNGYVSKYWETPIRAEFEECLESLLGLSIAFKIFRIKQEKELLNPRFNLSAVVYKNFKGNNQAIFTAQISEENSGLIRALEFNPGKKEEANERKLFPKLLQCGFGKDTEQQKIRTASRWFLKSYFFRNEIMAFVNAVIALEAVFGDQDEKNPQGSKMLVVNRCAFSLGTRRNRRNEIKKEILDIYEIRNKIVHQGKSKLSPKERNLFSILRNIVGDSLKNELLMILNEGKAV